MEKLFVKLKRKRDEPSKKTSNMGSGKLAGPKEGSSAGLESSLPLLRQQRGPSGLKNQRIRDRSMQEKLVEHSLEHTYRKAATRDNEAIHSLFTRIRDKARFQASDQQLNSNQNRTSNIHLKYLLPIGTRPAPAQNAAPAINEGRKYRRNLDSSLELRQPVRELSATKRKEPPPFSELTFGQKVKLSEAVRGLIFLKKPTNEALFTFSKILYVGLAYFKKSEQDSVEYSPRECRLSFPQTSKSG